MLDNKWNINGSNVTVALVTIVVFKTNFTNFLCYVTIQSQIASLNKQGKNSTIFTLFRFSVVIKDDVSKPIS